VRELVVVIVGVDDSDNVDVVEGLGVGVAEKEHVDVTVAVTDGGGAAAKEIAAAAGTLMETKWPPVTSAPLHTPDAASKPSRACGAATYTRTPSGETATSVYTFKPIDVSPPIDCGHDITGAVATNISNSALHKKRSTEPPEKATKSDAPSGETAKPRAPSCGALAIRTHSGGAIPPAAAAAATSARLTLATPLVAAPGTSKETSRRAPAMEHLRATAPATGSASMLISTPLAPSTRDGGAPASAGMSHSDPPLSTHADVAAPAPKGTPAVRLPPSAPDQLAEMSPELPSGAMSRTPSACDARDGAPGTAAVSKTVPAELPEEASSMPGAGVPKEAVVNGGDAEKSLITLEIVADTDVSTGDCTRLTRSSEDAARAMSIKTATRTRNRTFGAMGEGGGQQKKVAGIFADSDQINYYIINKS
jgi:hypothetical protein